MTRGKKWVIVGDQNQLPPFVDDALKAEGMLQQYGITRQELERTLFDELLDRLPAVNRVRLTVQHRMVRPIGDLISTVFYDTQLQSVRENSTIRAVTSSFDRPVMWCSTSQLEHRHEKRTSVQSFVNLEEAKEIRGRLSALQMKAQEFGEQVTVALISGYASQVNHLIRFIDPKDPIWRNLKIDIETVDAFQGQERDVCIYSVVRSNARGEFGFLSSTARLNVALSRGRDGLLIVGDSEHCAQVRAQTNPFLPVIDYIRSHPVDCSLVYATSG